VTVLEHAREVTRFEAAGRDVTVEAARDLRVVTDEALIGQAVVNLIENAVKYSKPGAPIHLKARAAGGLVELAVEDEGPGIAQDDLPFVFDRFYRSEEHNRRVKGSGLGLTIVKGFVELCGGKVRVESSAIGSRFTISLPAARSLQVPA
jgi:two-component system sensor histidine kinase SenX3